MATRDISKRLHEILEENTPDDWVAKFFDVFLVTLICLNVIMVILATVKQVNALYKDFFRKFEIFSVIVFTIEYVLRAIVCVHDKRFASPIKGRIKYLFSPLAIIDLLAILPFYLPIFFPYDLRFLRAIRILRILRILKIARYSDALHTLADVIRSRKEELGITLLLILVLLTISSSLVYLVEHPAQPEQFPNIPAAMWWGISTLTTIGYGDMYPITPLGKLLGGIVSILGIGVFALPTGILASGYIEEIQKRKKSKPQVCPHCGKEIP